MDIYEIRQALNSGKTIYDLPLYVTYYARVSTSKDEQRHSLSAQITYYQEMIQRNAHWHFVDGYIDEGISGTSVGKRENFLRMIDDARGKKFDFILTKEISRFSRNTLDSIQYTQELLRCGVGVFFQSDNINTLMPDAELRLTIMSSIAQDEVRKISERVRFGFKRAIENGVVLGSNRIWGYRKQEGKLVIDEEEAELVRLIFDLYANQKLGIRAIARTLTERGYQNTNGNGFSFSTIRGILSNPKYKGYYCGGKSSKIDYKLKEVKYFPPEDWVVYEDREAVPPIVSEALWEKANRLLSQRSAKQSAEDKSSYQNKYPYSGKILCGIHHTPYYRTLYRCKSGDKEGWQCQEYVKSGRQGCAGPVIYTYELDHILRQALGAFPLSGVVKELTALYGEIGSGTRLEERMARFQVQVNELLQRKDKLLDLNIGGRISDEEFSQRNDRFNGELKKLRERMQALEAEKARSSSTLPPMKTLQRAIEEELTFPRGFSQGVVGEFLDHVAVFGTEDKNEVLAEVYLKPGGEMQSYGIRRRRGKPSVCTRRYT